MKQILNVHGRLCKVALVALTLMFAASFAEMSLNVGIDARMRAAINNGQNSLSANFYDAGKITLGATIDNVSAEVVLSRNSDSSGGSQVVTDLNANTGVITVNRGFGNFLVLDSFKLKVNDLFSGLLSMELYNWDFGAGKSKLADNYLLSDITLVGAYFNVQPIDIFGFGVGYGVRGLSQNLGRDTIHAIKFNAKVGGPVPVNVYFGTTLTHGFTATLAPAVVDGTGNVTTPAVTRKRPFGVERMQIGVDADLYRGWVRASIGFTLPLGAAVSYIESPTSPTVKQDFILIGGVDGTIPFGDTGLSLDYGIFYATESFAKTLPNQTDSDLIDDFDAVMLIARVRPKYSLGIFAITMEVDVLMSEVWNTGSVLDTAANTTTGINNLIDAGVINDSAGLQLNAGSSVARYVKPTQGPRKPLGINFDPTLTITFAPNMSIDILYELRVRELSDRAAGVSEPTIGHTIGMNVKAAFGYTQ